MRFRLERRAVFQIDYIDIHSGHSEYTVTTRPATRSTTLEIVKHAGRRSEEIASVCFRELFPDTIELRDIKLATTVLSSSHTEGQYSEVVGERTKIKAKEYAHKEGKNTWTIHTPAAAVYTWTADGRELILRSEDDVEIAYIRPPRHEDDPGTGFATVFHIDDNVLEDIDQIVVSGVYLKYKVDHTGSAPSVENKYMPPAAISPSGWLQ
ncbi:unnamed protein product [Peniophora sp. CBMAI 1063]|nr:unnamed protein product [Peniophora sp. CBMAI 1063]